ncbi:integrase core domain-containing protein [Phytohabitans aurantiacus]|uniref:integrase core domain-containing protein n=1 Tax=Phytohabitans aurantiacus TaxID=3016789 RepID=UPI00389B2DEE
MPSRRRAPIDERDRLQRGQRRRESFNATFKRETLQGRRAFTDEREARLTACRWLHPCNTLRRHSRLGHQSPIAYENTLNTTSTMLASAA